MIEFKIRPKKGFATGEHYLKQSIGGYYHQNYTTFGTEGNPDFINYLKNQFNDTSENTLKEGIIDLIRVLREDLPKIRDKYSNTTLTVCVIPRAKKESYYSEYQKLFRKVVSSIVDETHGLENGTSYIIRHTNTRTTHMDRSGYGGDGDMPFVGITKATCNIASQVFGKDILLIDDIYTLGINIDEDAIQALLDNGAKNVYFYAVGKTYYGGF
jgi:hypothetical protein